MQEIQKIETEDIPRSLDYGKYLLAGLKNGNIVEYDVASKAKEVIMHSHD